MTEEFDTARDSTFERALPNSSEAERAVLGAILLVNSLISQAIEQLRPEDFYVPSHRRIFIAMIALFERGAEINPILIGEELKKENALEAVGGVSFITNLTYGLPHSTNIVHYAKVVRGKSMLRNLIKTLSKGIQYALDEEDQPEEILAGIEKDIFDISYSSNKQEEFSTAADLATKSIQQAHYIQQSGHTLVGLSTGFADVDSLTLGLQKSDMIIIAARPGVGKTSMGLSLAHFNALQDKFVIVFSLEMPKEQCIMRILCSAAKVDTQRYQLGYLNADEWSRLDNARAALQGKMLFINEGSGLSPTQIKAKAMRLEAEQKREVDLIVVDYLQLCSGSKKRYESDQQEVADISKDFKNMSKALRVPLVVLSQLSRAPENRTDHRPQLSDLRQSGGIEQDAAVVAFIFRGDLYRGPLETPDNTAEIIIAKNRNGRTGTKTLRFDAPSTSFANLYQS